MLILSPIVLFVYNRPLHTQETVKALQKNELAEHSELFIYSDAPKNDNAIEKVNEVRKYIKTINGFKKVTIIERKYNWGLANSIIDGVTTIVNQYGKIIVLEDDLLTSPYFLNFMNDALEFYKNKKKVWEVGAYVYPVDINKSFRTFFTPYTTSWGWATWNDRWEYFERNPKKLIESMSKEQIKKFNLDNSDDIWSQVVSNYNGTLYTWAVFWYANIFLNNGLTVYPYKSIVKNIGHDGSGENCGNSSKFDTELLEHNIEVDNDDIIINNEIYTMVKAYLDKHRDPIIIKILKRIYRKFKS